MAKWNKNLPNSGHFSMDKYQREAYERSYKEPSKLPYNASAGNPKAVSPFTALKPLARSLKKTA